MRYIFGVFELMALLILIAIIGTLASCGREHGDSDEQKNCTVVKIENQTTVTCPDGSSAVINDGEHGEAGAAGIPGAAGSNGAAGARGAVGEAGREGAIITTIYLCPTKSVEKIFCVDGLLYAKYASGHKSEYIPPGHYVVGEGETVCRFTVIKGCEFQ